jgi:multidrug efflux pump subunit AcrA (membrane-fusion protein)
VKLEVRPELKQTVTASGEVRPIRYIKLTSEVPGRIEEIYVTAGDMVTKGKPLVRVDPTSYSRVRKHKWAATQASINDVQSARNAVNSAQQSLVVAESQSAAGTAAGPSPCKLLWIAPRWISTRRNVELKRL